jgi:hypothetical protein
MELNAIRLMLVARTGEYSYVHKKRGAILSITTVPNNFLTFVLQVPEHILLFCHATALIY